MNTYTYILFFLVQVQGFLIRKKKIQANEANLPPCPHAFPRRPCVRAPFTNVTPVTSAVSVANMARNQKL